MFGKSANARVAEKVAQIVNTNLRTYKAGFEPIPAKAFLDRYVVGYINSFILGIAESMLRRHPSPAERWRILESAWMHVSPATASESYQIGCDEFNSPTKEYLQGIGAGSMFVTIIEKGVPSSAPEPVLAAIRMAEGMTQQRPIPAAAVGGILLSLDLHGYIKSAFSPNSAEEEKKTNEIDSVIKAGKPAHLRTSESLAALDEEINAIIKLIKRKQTHLGQEPESPRIGFLNWEGRPAILIGPNAWVVPTGSSEWKEARYEEVLDSGYFLADTVFVQMFPKRPPLTLEMAGLNR